MKKIILLLFVTFLTLSVYSKGGSGAYNITGKAFDSKGELLGSSKIIVEFNKQKAELLTDEEGNYTLRITWSTACPSGITNFKRNRLNKKLNPKWITLIFENKTVKIKNEWNKYAGEDGPKIENIKFA